MGLLTLIAVVQLVICLLILNQLVELVEARDEEHRTPEQDIYRRQEQTIRDLVAAEAAAQASGDCPGRAGVRPGRMQRQEHL